MAAQRERHADGLRRFIADRQHRLHLARHLRTVTAVFQVEYRSGSPWGSFPKPKGFFEKLRKLSGDFVTSTEFSKPENEALEALADFAKQLVDARSGQHPNYDFSKREVGELGRVS